MLNRRMFTVTLAGCLLGAPAMTRANQTLVQAKVFRTPDCGCCGAWIAHLEEDGFVVEVEMTDDMQAVKARHAVPPPLRSCHTALIEGYVIEGHVPAADIRSLLGRRLAATGLAVPGMPVGSPGMEIGGQRDPYDVILWTEAGTHVFSSHRG